MIQLILFLALGIVFLVLMYLFARRAYVRSEGGAVALLEARQALNSLRTGLLPAGLVDRIFAQEDLDFVSSLCSADARELFLRERKRIALCWIAQVRNRALSLRRFYSGQSRLYANIDPRTELSLALNFASLLLACRVLQVLFYLRGPYPAPKLVGKAVGIAGHVCAVSERSLAFLLPGIGALGPESAHNGVET